MTAAVTRNGGASRVTRNFMRRTTIRGARFLVLMVPLALGDLACTGHAPVNAAPSNAATAAPPPVLVTIVVDQLAAWIAAERWPQLPVDGGFARLRREGLYVQDLRYEHAATDTAPGHAALFTGNVPRQTGIFANETIATAGGASRSILLDPSSQVVGVDTGVTDKPGSTLVRLARDTVADRFVAEVPGAQVFSFSLKDRGALFGGGRKPAAALWLDTDLAEFVTSTAFPAPPGWASALAGKAALLESMREGWQLSDDERDWVAKHAETGDDQAGEGSGNKLGVTFPHPIQSAKAWRATPLADRVLLALARAAIDVARANRRPTLLALSLSSNDYVGHTFGPHSWEAWDELYRLDRALGEFLAFLDRSLGPTGYAVMLAADHGSVALPELSDTPNDPWCVAEKAVHVATVGTPSTVPASGDTERWQRHCGTRLRIDPHAALGKLELALDREFDAGAVNSAAAADHAGAGDKWIAGVADPYLYLSPKARGLAATERARLIATVAKVLAPLGIADVVDARATRGPCSQTDSSIAGLVCRSISPDGDGDLYLVVRPGAFLDASGGEGRGINHGSPYLYDRAVPLLVRAPGRAPAGRVRQTPASFASFARTASSLLGIHPPATDSPAEDLSKPSDVP